MRNRQALRVAQACLAGVALGLLVVGSLPPWSYRKDLQQEYLTAWALRDGVDLFTPITELSARYFPVPTPNFPHPNPHPPVLALLSLPITLLPFPVVAIVWLALNVGVLVVVGRRLELSFPGSLALAAWPPLWYLLLVGQFELVILALAMFGWRAAAAGRDARAGLGLGLAASIKLYPVLLLLPFVVGRRVRLLLAAAAVLLLSQVGSLAAVGVSGFVRYYREVLPAVAGRYVGMGLNVSPYGALLRLFGGATDVYPLLDAPGIVAPLAVVVSVLALLAMLRLEPEAAPAGVLVACPLVWYTYPVLALPEIVRLLRAPAGDLRRAALVAAAATSFVLPLVNMLVTPLGRAMEWTDGKAPPVAALLASVQPVGLVALLVLSVIARRRLSGRMTTGQPRERRDRRR